MSSAFPAPCSRVARGSTHLVHSFSTLFFHSFKALFSFQKILPPTVKNMFGHMHGVLNVDEKKLIAQFSAKSRDESFKPN